MTKAQATIELIGNGEAIVEMEADNGHFAIGRIGSRRFCGSLYELGYKYASHWAASNNYRLERYSRA